MSEVGETPVEISLSPETEPRSGINVIVSTDITSGKYFRGIKALPLERDDGLALLMMRNSAREGKLNPLLVMSTFANTSGETTYRSLEKLGDYWGEDKPEIARGADKPGEPRDKAVDLAINTLRFSSGSVTLIGLGAFTDIAAIVKKAKEEEISDKISGVVLTVPKEDVEEGNLSFNSKADPQAFEYLRESGIKLIYGWGGVLKHGVTDEVVRELEQVDDPFYDFVTDGLEKRNKGLATLSSLSEKIGMDITGVLPESEKREGRMCIQDMIVPVFLTRPDLFKQTETEYGLRVEIVDHKGVDKQIKELIKPLETDN